MDARQQASSQLEREAWRTTQRESRGGYEQIETAGKWGLIATAILNYQNKNNGQSPTDYKIARDTGLTLTQIHYHMREMEKAGLIADRKGWPRHIAMNDIAKIKKITQLEVPEPEEMKEAEVVHSEEVATFAAKRSDRAAFIVRAKQVGQAIIDHYDQFGKAPRMKWIRHRVYGTDASGGGLSGVVKKMVQLGWVYHRPKCKNDLAVTGLGRAALFGQVDTQLHTDTPINPMPNALSNTVVAPAAPPQIAEPSPLKRFVERQPRSHERATSLDLSNASDVDLIIELNNRGFKVTR